jgi:hypothetical protein
MATSPAAESRDVLRIEAYREKACILIQHMKNLSQDLALHLLIITVDHF